MDESLLAFARSLEVGGCRIVNAPNLIFLCGGRMSDAENTGGYRSVRDYFVRHIHKNNPSIAKRLHLAEAIGSNFGDDLFGDLLELEEYLADLSDLIIIFVESEGSIAELGALAASKAVSPKILPVVNSIHNRPSFIGDGPIRRLDSLKPSLLFSHHWDDHPKRINDAGNLESFEDLSKGVEDVLLGRERTAPSEQKLRLESHGHSMLVIADLIDIIGITSVREITSCLNALGDDVGRAVRERYLFLLERLEIIKKIKYNNQVYYVTNGRGPFVRYDFKEEAEIKDRSRAKALIRSALGETDLTRARILRNHLKIPTPDRAAEHA